jgi:hypothetical protein
MIVFSTDFPLTQITSITFLESIKAWLLGSRYTTLNENDFNELLLHDEYIVRRDNQEIELIKFASVDVNCVGIKYTKPDHRGNNWITNVVLNQTHPQSWVGIRIFCESEYTPVHLPKGKKPVLVQTFLDKFEGGLDGKLIVDKNPIFLQDVDITLAAQLISGKVSCRLPVVYISAGFQGEYIIHNIERLAVNLAGMAHILVEPSREFSVQLRRIVESENAYGGTIGIYWPDGGGRRSFFIGDLFESQKAIVQALCDEIQMALINRRVLEECTWSYVQEMVSHQRFEILKASGSEEINQYVTVFDQEIRAKEERLKRAENEIERLKAELRQYQNNSQGGQKIAFKIGEEQDFYPNEISGVIRDAVSDTCERVQDDSRRLHILQSFIAANPVEQNLSIEKREDLKRILKGYSKMNSNTKRELQDLGFSITEDGKHYKLTFKNDKRYTYALPKSGSDVRGGLNAASSMGNLFF